MLYFPQWHPQCLTFTATLQGLSVFLVTNHTAYHQMLQRSTNTNPTITVPILQDTSLSIFPYLFFPSDGSLALHSDDFILLLLFTFTVKSFALFIGSYQKVDETDHKKDGYNRADAESAAGEQSTELVDAKGNHISQTTLITDCCPEPSGIVHLTS